jgi:uncharacterized hydrophobic protein (TIGR00271 family)
MLHVRLVSPPDLTGRVTGILTADSGVVDLVILRGAARQPDGDAVQFDLQTRSANQVLNQLRDLGLNARGPVTIDMIDAEIEGPERRTRLRGSWHGETAPVWDVVGAWIRRDSAYAPSFFILLVIAGLIGAVGILINSQILIVAAMVVGPEYNAIISVAFGIERRDWHPVRGGLMALTVGFAAAIVMALVFAIGIRLFGQVPAPFLAGLRPVADLINSPDLFSVVIAVLAGIVGVVSLTESKANAMIGVFISVTTIPAASAIGVSAAFGLWRDAEGSAVQLLLNAGLLIGIGALAMRAQRRLWRGRTGSGKRDSPASGA